ncbi:hypothetical protein [Caballeronia calidae]|uniref:hypothetical protein n=1 Tax=Caballeronia calidae TaxID=1777139 RepID=UPI0012FD4A39|nr:hypothetical protein [Caballeronia calidae]
MKDHRLLRFAQHTTQFTLMDETPKRTGVIDFDGVGKKKRARLRGPVFFGD